MEFRTNDAAEFQKMLKHAVMDGLLFKAKYLGDDEYIIVYTGGY